MPRHRRGGKLVKLRRLASLRNIINADSLPSWQTASKIWEEINALEPQRNALNKNNTKSTKHFEFIKVINKNCIMKLFKKKREAKIE